MNRQEASMKQKMTDLTALEIRLESVTTQHHVPLIVIGANGEPVALHAVKGIRTGSLSNQLNTVEQNV